MAHGGKRPGAGRKKGLEAEIYRQVLLAKIGEHKEALAAALVNKGLTGDVPALKEINERALGKVKDNMDLTVAFSLSKLFNKTVNEE
jgi:hypothetical protein